MTERGFQQWNVRRTDLGSSIAGAYHPAKTKGNPNPPPVQSNVVVYADSLVEALQQGADLMGVSPHVCTARVMYSGFGVGESG
jgi:hypothetical protein